MKLLNVLSAVLAVASVADAAPQKGSAHPKVARKTPGASYIPGAYTVEFEPSVSTLSDPTGNRVDPTASIVSNLRGKYKDSVKKGITIQSTLGFNAVTVQLPKGYDLNDLADLPNVKRVFPVKINKRPKVVRTSAQQAAGVDLTPHTMTGVDKVHASGRFGKGVKVAVIDTGVYWKHPALGGCFGKGCKVSFGADLVGDAYDADTNPAVVPDADPMDDCSNDSHGTHTTGIIGANATGITATGFVPFANWVGVAPQATLGHYRIFGCNGNNGDDVMAQAVFRAFEDGAQVISISIGEAGVVPDESLTIKAIDMVSKAGVQVIVSAGNDGANGLWTIGDPAIGSSAFAVASIDNHATLASAIFGPDGTPYVYAAATAGGWVNEIKTQIVQADPTDGCASKNYTTAGKVLLVKYNGACKSSQICGNAAAQNATGCLIYNVGGIAGNPAIPGGSIDDAVATKLLAALKANPDAVFRFTNEQTLSDLPTAKTASDFTSYGMDAELNFKPDLAGVGGSIYSTVSPHAAAEAKATNAYLILSGTSMACPYVAGTVALLVEQKGSLSVQKTKALLQNNAQLTGIYNTSLIETPVRVGAGLVDISRALKANTLITPSFLALNDTKHTKTSYTLLVKNTGKASTTYTFEHVGAALATGAEVGNDMPIPLINYTPDYATVTFSPKKLSVGAGKSAQVTVSITAPAKADPKLLPVFSGYIKAKSTAGETLTVPYAGVKGDYSAAKMFVEKNPTPGSTLNGVYTPSGDLITPGAILNATTGIDVQLVLGQATRLVYVDVLPASSPLPTTQSLGVIVPVPAESANTPYSFTVAGIHANQPRNTQQEGQGFHTSYALNWQGIVAPVPADGALDTPRQHGNNTVEYKLPAGSYQIRFSALKHFGKVGNPKDYEVVTSPAFQLVY